MNSERSKEALELLQAEMLGDVGRLHSLVESLKRELPGMVAEIRKATQEAHNPQLSVRDYLKEISKTEIKAIHAAGLTARSMAIHELSGAFTEALRNVHGSVEGRGKDVWNKAIGDFANSADKAISTISEKTRAICGELDAAANGLRRESTSARLWSMLFVSVATGICASLVTALTIHALK